MNCFICNNDNKVYAKLSFLCIDEDKPLDVDLFICTCGFAYYRHNEINKTYKENSKYTNSNTGSGALAKYDIERLQNTFSNVSSYINPDDKILDVGCNNGTFLRILYENNFRNLTGTDFSINRAYTSQLEKAGVTIYEAKSLKEVSFNDKFDFISLNHVLEHVDGIDGFINELKYNLKYNGLLYIEVPDASRYEEQYFQPFSYFDLEHINHFNIENLSLLLNKHGFEKIDSFSFDIAMSEYVKYPGIGVIFKNNDTHFGSSENFQISSNKNIESFYKKSLSEISNYQFKGSFDNIVIYGVGANTLRSLGILQLSIENIKYFVDKNELFHNRFILNKEIKSIDYLMADSTHPDILIFSKLYYDEILKDLRSRGIENNIYSFY